MSFSIKRREFLEKAVFASAAAILHGGEANGQAKAGEAVGALLPVRLGMASYTFREFTRAQLIDFMKQLSLHSINLKDVKDHLPSNSIDDEMKAVADYEAEGIVITAAGAIYFTKDDDTEIRAKFEYCKRAGVKVIVAGDPPLSMLPRIEKFVKEYDMRFAIHNHGPEDALWHSPLDVLKAVGEMDSRMGCCIDVGHTMRTGVDVVEAIRAAGPRLFDIHIKDVAKADAKESQVAVGRGIMPIRRIFETLIAMKYAGHVDLEYEIHADDPMPGVIESVAYMRGVLAGMA